MSDALSDPDTGNGSRIAFVTPPNVPRCQNCGKRDGDRGLEDLPVKVGPVNGKLLCSDCWDALCWAWEH